jgi:hypothetical protein
MRTCQIELREADVEFGQLKLSPAKLTLSSGQLKLSSANPTLSSGQLKLSSAKLTLSSGQLNLSSAELTLSSGQLNLSSARLTLSSGQLNLSSANPTLSSGQVNLSSEQLNVEFREPDVEFRTSQFEVDLDAIWPSTQLRHPWAMGVNEVNAFSSHLAVDRTASVRRRITRPSPRCSSSTGTSWRNRCRGWTTSCGRSGPNACQWC